MDLQSFVKYADEMTTNESVAQFKALGRQEQKKSDVYPIPFSAGLNRYFDIAAYTHSRVELSTIPGQEYSDYINANYVGTKLAGTKAKYIAASAPTQKAFGSFWRMIMEKKVNIIVMLTKLKEGSKTKADMYWPGTIAAERHGGYYVRCEFSNPGDHIEVREFTINKLHESALDEGSDDGYSSGGSGCGSECGSDIGDGLPRFADDDEEHTVTMYQFTGWPDYGKPEEFEGTIKLFEEYRRARPYSTGPILVHCSAGVGRSGTFIALDALFDHLALDRNPSVDKARVDINTVILNMREGRNYMVQSPVQYQYLHVFLSHCLKNNLFGVGLSQSGQREASNPGHYKLGGGAVAAEAHDATSDINLLEMAVPLPINNNDPDGLMLVEHVNLHILSPEVAEVFYCAGLGCQKVIRPEGSNLHVNCGPWTQFHLPSPEQHSEINTTGAQVFRGQIQIAYYSAAKVQEVTTRLKKLASHPALKDTKFAVTNTTPTSTTVTGPYGNSFLLVVANTTQQYWGMQLGRNGSELSDCLGIVKISMSCPQGKAGSIAEFYKNCLGLSAAVEGQTCVISEQNDIQTMVYTETTDNIPPATGDHICIYMGNHMNAAIACNKRGAYYVHPLYDDTSDKSLQQKVQKSQQFRISGVFDTSGHEVYGQEHEIRSRVSSFYMQLYMRPGATSSEVTPGRSDANRKQELEDPLLPPTQQLSKKPRVSRSRSVIALLATKTAAKTVAETVTETVTETAAETKTETKTETAADTTGTAADDSTFSSHQGYFFALAVAVGAVGVAVWHQCVSRH